MGIKNENRLTNCIVWFWGWVVAHNFFPVTIAIALLVATLGLANETWWANLASETRVSFGQSPQHVIDGSWYRLVTSLPITGDPSHLRSSLVMIILCVGWHEVRYSWSKTVIVFLSAHFLTMLIESVILNSLHWMGSGPVSPLLIAHDVGPSAGYYGCLGSCIYYLPARLRYPFGLAICVWLVLRWTISSTGASYSSMDVRSDLAHWITWLIGYTIAAWSGAFWSRPQGTCQPATPDR
jgi:hypothetical protein